MVMQNYSKLVAGIGVAVGVVALGILVGWWGSKGTSPEPAPVVQSAPTANVPRANDLPATATNVRPDQNESAPADSNPHSEIAARAPVPAAPDLITNWQERVNEILGSDDANSNKVDRLFALFPRVPAKGQSEVAQDLSNLVPNAHYARLARLLEDPKLPEGVLDELMSDALNRPNSMKLPVLLQVAENTDHPKAGEAKDLLELYLDDNYGTNWAKWRHDVQQWLKDNPD